MYREALVYLAEGADQLSALTQLGVGGIIAALALIAVRVLFAREAKTLDLERARADRLEQELRRLNESIHDRYVPTLTQATAAIAEALSYAAKQRDRQ